jgi:HEAT repeat protein/SMI1/KNR4 family protein SUKH-1
MAAMADIDETLERISAKLTKVRQAGLSCFGSGAHGFRLKDPLPEAEVAAFESEHGIALPEDYRAFITLLGGQGAGPYYGLTLLSEWDQAVYVDDENMPGFVARSCPLVPGLRREDNWIERLGLPEDELFQGTIAIGHQGCSYYTLLVISGEARGRVLYMDEGLQPPYFVENDSFVSWYERWLDELLAGSDGSWFGFGLPGGDDELRDILETADSASRRAEAASSIARLPSVSEVTKEALISVASDPNSEVRAAAIGALGRVSVAASVEALRKALDDEDDDVRRAAVQALYEIRPKGWDQDARRALSDRNSEVVLRAVFLLSGEKLLRAEDCEPLLSSKNSEMRSHGAYGLGQVGGPRARQLLESALSDPDSDVRLYAAQGLSIIGNSKTASVVNARIKTEQDERVSQTLRAAKNALTERSIKLLVLALCILALAILIALLSRNWI